MTLQSCATIEPLEQQERTVLFEDAEKNTHLGTSMEVGSITVSVGGLSKSASMFM